MAWNTRGRPGGAGSIHPTAPHTLPLCHSAQQTQQNPAGPSTNPAHTSLGRPAGRTPRGTHRTVLLVRGPSWLLPSLGQQDWQDRPEKDPRFLASLAGTIDGGRPAYGMRGPGESGPAASNHRGPATARLSQTSHTTARVASPLNCQAAGGVERPSLPWGNSRNSGRPPLFTRPPSQSSITIAAAIAVAVAAWPLCK